MEVKNVTNTAKLLEYIEKSGLKKSYIAKAIGTYPTSLSKKIRNERDFTVPEMKKLCNLLRIPAAERELIFFAD